MDKWYNRMKCSTKPKKGRAVYNVRVENGNKTEEVSSEEGIFSHVSTNFSERFKLAFTAKCYSGQLFDDIGFLGDTDNAKAILEGTYIFPNDTDLATKLLVEEAVHTYLNMPRKVHNKRMANAKRAIPRVGNAQLRGGLLRR